MSRVPRDFRVQRIPRHEHRRADAGKRHLTPRCWCDVGNARSGFCLVSRGMPLLLSDPGACVFPRLRMSKLALVVDDSMLIRYTVSRFLEERGFAVESATNGAEALEVVSRMQPDLIFTDMQ